MAVRMEFIFAAAVLLLLLYSNCFFVSIEGNPLGETWLSLEMGWVFVCMCLRKAKTANCRISKKNRFLVFRVCPITKARLADCFCRRNERFSNPVFDSKESKRRPQNLLRLGHPELDRATRAMTQRTCASCHTAAVHRQLKTCAASQYPARAPATATTTATVFITSSSSHLHEKKVRRSGMATTKG